MIELHSQILNLADRFENHYWSKRMTDTDSKFVGEVYKQLIGLSNVAYNMQQSAKAQATKLEDENKKLRAESWEDGDKITTLEAQIKELAKE